MEELKNKQETKQENKVGAIFISLLIAVAGAIVWGVLYTEGWFVSIISYVTAFLMLKAYKKNCSNVGKGVYAYVIISIIVLNCVASFLAIALYCADLYQIEFSVVLNTLLANFGDFAEAFIEDMIWGSLFAVLGVVSTISYDKRMAQQKAQEEAINAQNIESNVNKEEPKPAENFDEKQEKPEEKLGEKPTKNVAKKDDDFSKDFEFENQSKFCTQCGTKLRKNAKKCQNCGAEVEE